MKTKLRQIGPVRLKISLLQFRKKILRAQHAPHIVDDNDADKNDDDDDNVVDDSDDSDDIVDDDD